MIRFWAPFLALTGAWLAYGLACATDDEPVFRLVSQEPVHAEVQAGGTLAVRYTVDRFRTCAVRRVGVLYDGSGAGDVVMDETMPANGPLGHDVYVVEREVPYLADPGEARYRVTLTFNCPVHVGRLRLPNAFQAWTPAPVVLPDVPFRIVRGTAR